MQEMNLTRRRAWWLFSFHANNFKSMPSSHSPNSPSKDADGRREREQGEGKEEKERKRKEMMAQEIKIFHIKFFNKVGCGAHALIPVFQGQRLVDL